MKPRIKPAHRIDEAGTYMFAVKSPTMDIPVRVARPDGPSYILVNGYESYFWKRGDMEGVIRVWSSGQLDFCDKFGRKYIGRSRS